MCVSRMYLFPSACRQRRELYVFVVEGQFPCSHTQKVGVRSLGQAKIFTVEMTNDLLIPSILGL